MESLIKIHYASTEAETKASAEELAVGLLCKVLVEQIIDRERPSQNLPGQLRLAIKSDRKVLLTGVYSPKSDNLRVFEPGVLQYTDCDVEVLGPWTDGGWELRIECAFGDLWGRTWRVWVDGSLNVVRKDLECIS